MRAIRRLFPIGLAFVTVLGSLMGCLPEKKQIPVTPRVLGQTPRPGQELSLSAPVVIDFSEPMDEGSVKQALRIDPPVDGQISVKGDRVSFAPSGGGFKRATQYRVTVGTQAKSTKGVALEDEVVLRFSTIGYLAVAEVQPSDGSSDVDRKSSIVVMFNRPVVALTDLKSKSNLPQPLTLDPAVQGSGQWLNTAIYQFTPSAGLAGSTRYKATIKAGLQDTVGSILDADYTWAFTTSMPSAIGYSPRGEQIAPTAVISATFNQPMDQGSVESLFRMTNAESGQAVAGTLTVAGELVTFKPAQPLAFDAMYRVRFGKGTKSASGGTLAADLDWTFVVVPLPSVVSTTPSNGDRNASPYGGVQIAFAGPMLLETITPTLRVEPAPKDLNFYYNDSDARLFLSFSVQPATEYRVTIPGNAADPYGNTLGEDHVLVFRTRDLDPMVYLQNTGSQVASYDAYTRTVAAVSVRNVSEVDLKLYSVGLDEFVRYNGDDYDYRNKFAPAASQLLRQWSVPSTAERNTTELLAIPLEASAGQTLEPGTYYLEITAPELAETAKGGPQISKSTFLVTHTDLTLKTAPTGVLVWATDLKSGQALPNQRVTIYDSTRTQLATGTTDADGLYSTDLPTNENADPYRNVFAVISEGSAFGVVGSSWASGIEPYQYSIFSEYYRPQLAGYVYTDRPIYRPAQKVYYKGVIRQDNDVQYSIPQPLPLSVTIRDSENREVYSQTVTLSDMGTFDGEIALGADAALGPYSISAGLTGAAASKNQPDFYGSFQVAAYRKPEFEITVATDHDEYVQGDRAGVTVSAHYYFGAPLSGGKTQWTVTSSSYSFPWTGDGWYDFSDYEALGYADLRTPQTQPQVLAQGEGVTDAQGTLKFEIQADIGKFPQSQVFTIEATTTDVNNQQVAGRTTAIVHKGLFYIGLRPESVVSRVGQPAKVDIITVDAKSAPVPQTSVTVVFNQRQWFSAQERADDGNYYWTSRYVDTPVFTQTVTTDAKGQAIAQFTPDAGGSYRVVATANDSRGNLIRSATYLWVSGSSDEYVSWQQNDNNRITPVPDKKSYAPGDTAHVLIPSPFQGDTLALVTIERGGILSRKVVTLQGNSALLDVPITSEMAPNVYFSVVIVKGQDATTPAGSFRVGYVELDVSTVEKELTIHLTPDRKGNYGPREPVTYSIETLDNKGQGVSADLSLALVDLSVLALVSTPENAIRSRFYGTRGLGVRTATSAGLEIDMALQRASLGLGKGGGGGADSTVRTDFPDTTYWNARFRTDASGKGQVTVTLPDSLTTWRLTVVGATAATQVGEATVDIIATKDLLVRAVAPRFFVIGDQAGLSAIVQNNTDQALRARVALTAQGLQVSGAEQTVDVPAHGLNKVTWTVTAQAVDQAVVQFSADAGSLKDALQLTLPVSHYTTPETVATAGQVPAGEQRMERVSLPQVYEPSQGDLRIQVDPSLAAGALEGLSYLEHYPYECIEQTISRFLPNVVTLRALRELGVSDPELEAKLPQLVSVGLQKIYASQKLDGGWGWWANDDSDAFVTAYVLFALGEAKRIDLAVDSAVIQRGTAYLKRSHNVANLSDSSEANRQAFVSFVLAQLGQGDNGRAVSLFDQHEKLDTYGRAFLALALKSLGSEHASRIQTLVGELVGNAISSATTTHWEEAAADWRNMGTDVRTTAIVLRALVALDPQNPMLANTVRWLMTARVEGRWATTQDNAWALMALTDYMAMTGELAGQYNFQVGLNGKRVLGDTVSPDTVRNPRIVSIPIKDLLKDNSNSVLFDRTAVDKNTPDVGTMYYSMDLRYYLPVDQVEALDNGLVVSREYTLMGKPETPIHEAQVNDTILVTVTLTAPINVHYLILEDPIPAGTEAVDTSLKTTSSLLQPPTVQPQPTGKGGVAVPPAPTKIVVPPWFGYQYFGHSELLDDKVALFATYLPRGTYEYSYLIRASVPGKYLVMPTLAYPMYAPETFGRSSGETFTITE